MNPRLIKLAVEIQNAEKVKKTEKTINFKNKFFNFLKPVKITVPVNKEH